MKVLYALLAVTNMLNAFVYAAAQKSYVHQRPAGVAIASIPQSKKEPWCKRNIALAALCATAILVSGALVKEFNEPCPLRFVNEQRNTVFGPARAIGFEHRCDTIP